MTRLFFVLNELADFDFGEILKRLLPDAVVDIGTELPPATQDYRLIVLWNYRRVIDRLPNPNNVVLFHGSDLPEGRGWAPIYYTISEGRSHYVLSGIFAAPKVDSGDIVVKARVRIEPNMTASDLRKIDSELSLLLVGKILERFDGRPITGVPQRPGNESYRKRRTKEDNRIDGERKFSELIPHLRACEPSAPAFFEYEGCRYTVTISADEPAVMADRVEVIFGEDLGD